MQTFLDYRHLKNLILEIKPIKKTYRYLETSNAIHRETEAILYTKPNLTPNSHLSLLQKSNSKAIYKIQTFKIIDCCTKATLYLATTWIIVIDRQKRSYNEAIYGKQGHSINLNSNKLLKMARVYQKI